MLLALLLAAAPPFDPLRFFAGRTEGTGRLHVAFRHARDVRVHGTGRAGPDGFRLVQRVEEQGAAPRTRRWLLRRIAPGRYTGTLTDARGPVLAETRGNRLHIRYGAKGKLVIEQWLTLASDGRSAVNRLTAKRLGVVVAKLNEVIRRVD